MEEPPKPSSPLQPQPEQQPSPKRQKMSTTTTSDDEANRGNNSSLPRKPKYKRRKIAIFFAYCGVGYQGMQKNPGAKTIEADLEEAIFLAGGVPEEERGQPNRFDWARSSRTDKGVSAVGQVVSGRFFVDPPGFIDRLNSHLVPQIRIFGFKRTTPSFSAKKFCDRRRYVYLIPVFALDPSRHRDRESVVASLGSGEELVKCLECSERGRKVFGAMGKRPFGPKSEAEFASDVSNGSVLAEKTIEEENGIDNTNSEIISSIEIEKVKDVKEDVSVVTIGSSNICNGETKLDNGSGNVICGVEESVVLGSEKMELGNSDENAKKFSYGEEEKGRFNRILKYYEGTHNYHNFTTRTKAEDPAAKRYILSFNANTVLNVGGIDFVKCVVVGQSFMLHQIRKMIGLAVAIMRNYAPESIIETALQQKPRITVPMAPEVGLYLDECFFPSYNQKWGHTHEELSMDDYAVEAEEFKMKHIYSHIASAERKDGAVALWLHSLNYRNYPDLRVADLANNSEDGVNVENNETVSQVKPNDVVINDETVSEGKHIDEPISEIKHIDEPISEIKHIDEGFSEMKQNDNITE